MANGYIGKISAVVTANTSDLERKLSGAVKNVDVFANRLAASIERSSKSAQDSLNSIFTPLQRLERNLQAGLSGNVFKRDNVEQYVRSVRQAVSISEQINKPLASGAAAFQKLSLEVQAGFLPALNRAQSAAVNLSNTLQQQGGISERTFGGVEQVVNRTTEALRRLGQAQQLAVSGFSGNELQFTYPRAFQALQSAAASTSMAAELPASALADGNIQRQVQRLQQFRNLIAQTIAEVEEIRLRPNVDQTALAAAERRLDNIVETTLRAKAEFDRAVKPESRGFVARDVATPARGLGLFGSQAGTDAEAAIEQARRVSAQYAKLPEAARAGISGLAGIAARLSDQVQATGNNAEQLLLVLQRLERQIEATQQPPSQNTGLTLYTPPVEIAATGGDLVKGFQKLKDDRASAASAALGRDIGDPIRQVDALGGSISGLKGQLDSLPASIQSRLIPAVKQVQEEFVRLRVAGAGATADQIEKATKGVQRLEQSVRRATEAFNFRSSFGGAGAAGIEDGLNQQALGGYTAQLQILQQTLAGTSQAARGPAVAAFNNLRNAIADAMESGTLETEQTRLALKLLTQDAVRATASVSGVSADKLGQRLKRAGDIGRGAFGNFGLAVQQAAFIVDDFFSVSGGLDQRIRAIGNNVSQLGFIIGSTGGLVAGVALSIGSQLAVALINYANSGRTSEDQARALNAALDQQKNAADGLAASFQAIADTLAGGVFSSASSDLERFREQVAKLREEQSKAREQAGVSFDRGALQNRADVSRISRQLESATDPVTASILQRQIREIEDSQRRVAGSFRARATPTAQQAIAAISGAGSVLSRQVARDAGSPFRDRLLLPRVGQVQRIAGGVQIGDSTSARIRQLESLREAQGVISGAIPTGFISSTIGPNAELGRDLRASLEGIIDAATLLERDISAAVDESAFKSLEAIRESAGRIERNLSRLEEAAGAPGAREAASEQESLGRRLRQARDRLSQSSGIDDVLERNITVTAIRRDIAEIEKSIAARQSEVDAVLSVTTSVEAFADSLGRISNDLAGEVAQEARRAAEQSRRDTNSSAARFGRLGDERSAEELRFNESRRGRLQSQAASAELQAFRLEQENSRRLQQFQADADSGLLGPELQALIRQRDEAQRILDNQNTSGFRRLEATRQLDAANFGLRREFEGSAFGRAARQQADEIDRAAQQAAQREADILRGRVIRETPAARAGRELADSLRQLETSFDQDVADGVINRGDADAQLADARRRQIDEAFRSQAPAIAGLADSVANAVLQGPSRAALNATDVSTVEGARELNRLIRGDDAARDQNLEELRRQSQQLDQLIQAVKDNGGDVAN